MKQQANCSSQNPSSFNEISL